jgi:hypothetical protein
MKSDDCCAATEATITAAVAPADRVAPAHRARSSPVVEVLYFDGCPNHEPSVALVERVAKELGLQPEIRLVNVTNAAAAARLRFLGSPTVRVDGRDIEPGAEQRSDFVLSCRVFRTECGFSGEPDERWVRDALLRERAVSSEIKAARPLEASPAIAAALAATGIPPERLGASRSARLSTAERALYLWILRRFATEGPPAAEAIRTKAAELGLGLAQVCEKLAAEDLVHFDPVGEVVVAYPFSGRPRGHRVLIDGLRWVEAMCAIDRARDRTDARAADRDQLTRPGQRRRGLGATRSRRRCLVGTEAGGRAHGQRLLRRAQLQRLLRRTQLLRVRAERRALPARARADQRLSDLDRGGERARPQRLRRHLQGGLMPAPIDRDEVQRLLAEESGQLVEVLPPDEYADEHLPGAINIPLKTLDAETTRRLERERPVIVYCHDYQ